MTQKTFAILKPDALKRGLVGEIISRIEKAGLKIEAMQVLKLDASRLAQHYHHIAHHDFYKDVADYMQSGDSIIMILSGVDAVQRWRKMMGATKPQDAALGSIRGDLGIISDSVIKNLVHGSDSVENADVEMKIWF